MTQGKIMDWIQISALLITLIGAAASVVGVIWVTHHQTSKELRDFHGRMCTLEEKYIQMMQRWMESKK